MDEFVARSIVDIHEAELCRWLFGQSMFTSELCRKLGLSGPLRVYFEIPTAQMIPGARGPGNVDILVCDPSRPENTTVIEAKRVKISERTFASNEPTKLKNCAHGIEQANFLGKLGFHRAWLLVVVVTDGRKRPGVNFFSRGITFELREVICEHTQFAALATHIGLIFVYLDQPVDKDITLAGGFGFDVRQAPTNMEQPTVVTSAVRSLLTTGHA